MEGVVLSLLILAGVVLGVMYGVLMYGVVVWYVVGVVRCGVDVLALCPGSA